MQQSAAETVADGGGRFGPAALSGESIAQHIKRIGVVGFSDQLAGELPLSITVDEAANDSDTLAKVIKQGRCLVDEQGAESLVLGCAGLAALRRPTEQVLSLPVIEPAQAAVRLAVRRWCHVGMLPLRLPIELALLIARPSAEQEH